MDFSGVLKMEARVFERQNTVAQERPKRDPRETQGKILEKLFRDGKSSEVAMGAKEKSPKAGAQTICRRLVCLYRFVRVLSPHLKGLNPLYRQQLQTVTIQKKLASSQPNAFEIKQLWRNYARSCTRCAHYRQIFSDAGVFAFEKCLTNKTEPPYIIFRCRGGMPPVRGPPPFSFALAVLGVGFFVAQRKRRWGCQSPTAVAI